MNLSQNTVSSVSTSILYKVDIVCNQNNAEVAVKDMLRGVAERTLGEFGTNVLNAEDKMDDGSVIKLTVTLNMEVCYVSEVS